MKKAVALSAVLVLFALIGCTPKKTAPIDINTLPVTPIEYLTNVEYGPGSQTLELSEQTVTNGKVSELVMDVDYEISRLGENLVHRIQAGNVRVRKERMKGSVEGVIFKVALLSDVTGEVLSQDLSSDVLKQAQLEEMKKAINKGLLSSKLVTTSVKTGSVMFSMQNAMEDALPAGYSLDNVVLENILAGYVMYNGEKVLLVKCDQPDGKLREDATGVFADFGMVSYTMLRPGNLQCIYCETSVTVSIPEADLKMSTQIVVREK